MWRLWDPASLEQQCKQPTRWLLTLLYFNNVRSLPIQRNITFWRRAVLYLACLLQRRAMFNPLRTKLYPSYIKTQLVPCSKHSLPHGIKWNANLMQLGNFIDVLAWHVSGTYTHHQEHVVFCTVKNGVIWSVCVVAVCLVI